MGNTSQIDYFQEMVLPVYTLKQPCDGKVHKLEVDDEYGHIEMGKNL